MKEQARGLVEGCSALLLDFDGPMTRLLPPPRGAELAEAVRRPLRGAGIELPPDVAGSRDHLAVLRYVARDVPTYLREAARERTDAAAPWPDYQSSPGSVAARVVPVACS